MTNSIWWLTKCLQGKFTFYFILNKSVFISPYAEPYLGPCIYICLTIVTTIGSILNMLPPWIISPYSWHSSQQNAADIQHPRLSSREAGDLDNYAWYIGPVFLWIYVWKLWRLLQRFWKLCVTINVIFTLCGLCISKQSFDIIWHTYACIVRMYNNKHLLKLH